VAVQIPHSTRSTERLFKATVLKCCGVPALSGRGCIAIYNRWADDSRLRTYTIKGSISSGTLYAATLAKAEKHSSERALSPSLDRETVSYTNPVHFNYHEAAFLPLSQLVKITANKHKSPPEGVRAFLPL